MLSFADGSYCFFIEEKVDYHCNHRLGTKSYFPDGL